MAEDLEVAILSLRKQGFDFIYENDWMLLSLGLKPYPLSCNRITIMLWGLSVGFVFVLPLGVSG